MEHVGIRELKANLSSYVARVRNGEQIMITDHGQEAGIIIPISEGAKTDYFTQSSWQSTLVGKQTKRDEWR